MQEPMPDKTVISIIVATVLMIFLIVFLITSSQGNYDQNLEWRESSISSSQNMNL